MATIVIADDDPIILAFASEMLKETDHAVIVAEDGVQALRLLDTLKADLLITDMLMPNMDGIEVITRVRQRYPEVKILAITSGGSLGGTYLLDMAKRFGANAVLNKPLQLAPFLATVDHLIDAANASGSLCAGDPSHLQVG